LINLKSIKNKKKHSHEFTNGFGNYLIREFVANVFFELTFNIKEIKNE